MTQRQASGRRRVWDRPAGRAMAAASRAFTPRDHWMTTQNTPFQRPTTYRELARAWMDEIRRGIPDEAEPPDPVAAPDDPPEDTEDDDIGLMVVSVTFLRPAATQWDFLLLCVEEAETADQLGLIAAGPFEGLMGPHGVDYIDRVEAQAAADPKFARMVCGAWQYMMTDEVWARVQAIQAWADTS